MANLLDLVAKLTLDSSEYASGLDAALGKAKKIGGAITKVGAAAVGAAATGIVAFGKSAVDVGMTFDSSMSQVAATMGTTVDEISELRDFAQEMGSTTAFSATQAADALNYMALAGYDAEKSMKMLPNVLNLAAAGGIELASASDMVTDAQSALGLSLDETSELVNKMAKASSKSNTSVAQLGDAILTVGGTAKNLAGGTTELSTALGILADNGIKGAEGGTALRNIILSLSAPTDTAAKKMAELGLSAYDAEGNLRPMQDIFSDLNSTLSTMTQGEQTEVLNTLFNKVDLKSANALLATSADRWDKLSGEIDNASGTIDNAKGAAQQMADTQLDNLSGDITLFKSALEGAQIVLSDQLSPTLRKFVQLGTSGIQQITDGFKEGGIEGAFGALGDWLGEAINKVVQRLPTLIDSALSLLENVASALMDNSDQIIGTVFDVIKLLGKAVIDNAPVVIEAVFEILDNVVETLADPEFLGGLVDGAIKIIKKLGDSLSQNIPILLPTIVQMIMDITTMLTSPENMETMLNVAVALLGAIADGLVNSIDIILDEAPGIIDNLVKVLFKVAPKFFKSVFDVFTSYWGRLISLVWEKISGIGESIWGWLQEHVFTPISNFFSDVWNKIVEFFQPLIDTIQPVLDSLGELFSAFGELASAAWELIKQTVGDAVDKVKEKFGEIWDKVSKVATDVWNKITEVFGNLVAPIEQPLQDFYDKVTGVFNDAKDWILGIVADAWNWGHDLIQNIISGISSLIDSLTEKVKGVAGTIFSWLHQSTADIGPLKDTDKWGVDLMDNIINGIESKREELRREVEGVAESMDFNRAYTFTPTVTGTYNESATGRGEKIDRLINLLETYLPEIGHIELDGEVVANSVDQRLGRIAAQKARV